MLKRLIPFLFLLFPAFTNAALPDTIKDPVIREVVEILDAKVDYILKSTDGVVGPQGPSGGIGPIGADGPQGVQGIQGIQGVQGDIGPAGGEDNLGNHIATTTLNMSDFSIIDVSTVTASLFIGDGSQLTNLSSAVYKKAIFETLTVTNLEVLNAIH